MSDINYYDVLGVGVDADQDDIKRAYRSMARKYHPDMNKDKGSEIIIPLKLTLNKKQKMLKFS